MPSQKPGETPRARPSKMEVSAVMERFPRTISDTRMGPQPMRRANSLLRGKCVMGKDRNLLLASQFARSPRCLNECGKMVGGWWKAEGRRNYHHEEHEEHEGGKESRCFRPFMLFLLHGKKSFSALARKMALHHEEKGGHEGKTPSLGQAHRLSSSSRIFAKPRMRYRSQSASMASRSASLFKDRTSTMSDIDLRPPA